MAYEIRVVFQSAEAYRSAVAGLYRVFGVDLPATASTLPEGDEGPAHPAITGLRPAFAGVPLEDDDAVEPALPAGPLALDDYLAEDPEVVGDDRFVIHVEDQTRR